MSSERLLLAAYDAAWRLALGPLRTVAALDAGLKRAAGRGFLPSRWLAERRLQSGCAAGDRAASPAAPPTLWMHAASLGESKGLWALAERLLGDSPVPDGLRSRILLTANTAEGLRYLEERAAARTAAAPRPDDILAAAVAPLDHPGRVRGFLRLHNVILVCLYEVEMWPNYIRIGSGLGIPVVLVSGRMTERALERIRRLRGVWPALLDRLEWIMAQGEPDAARFRSLTRTPVLAGFDFKAARYFREAFPALAPDPGPRPEKPSGSRLAFLSLHQPELERFLPELPDLMARFPLTVIPRRPAEMAAFRGILEPMGFRLHSRSPDARHVVVDSLGQVASILPLCRAAFVGGSLVPLGCHNLWEPLLAGLKIYFGPSYYNQEALARALLDRGLAEIVEAPSRARAWREPETGIAEACRDLALAQMRFLEESESAFVARIGDMLTRFYLFSGAAMRMTR